MPKNRSVPPLSPSAPAGGAAGSTATHRRSADCPRHATGRPPWPVTPLAAALLVAALLTALPGAAAAGGEEAGAAVAAEASSASAAGDHAGAPLDELRAELAAMRRDYEARIGTLEARIAELEGGRSAATAVTAAPEEPEDELAALRAAARQASGTAEPGAGGAAATSGELSDLRASEPVTGRGSLNRLNPEISFTGDLVGIAGLGSGDGRDEFEAREFELDFQSALDPYSRTRWTLAFGPGGEVDVEEGYVLYNALPGGLGLTLGRFRQQFGSLNRQHAHALPQSDYPLALRTYFGDEGLAQTGVSARWLLPHPWASANELTLEVTDGENEAFGGEDFQDFAGLVHLKSYWDLGDAAYLEWGLSGAVGRSADGDGRRIWGSDLTVHWQPPSRAKYRELTWRTELLLSERDRPDGGSDRAWGGYTYAEGLIAQNLYAGARFDWVEDPLDPGQRTLGLVPYITWWQSEFVRLRGEFRHFENQATDRSDDQFLLQLTWAAGPHKHETY